MQKVLLKEFLDSEKSCGFILVVCVALSLLLSNMPIGEAYQGFWQMAFVRFLFGFVCFEEIWN